MSARTSFFSGMEPTVFDMTNSQIALTGQIKNRTNDFYTFGVVNGLTVYVDNTDYRHVTVGLGTAYDPTGERISVLSNVNQIGYHNAALNAAIANYTMVARYVEGNDGVTEQSPDGTSNYVHILDSYSLVALKNGTDPILTNDVRLSGVYVTLAGGTFIIDQTVRDTASARLGGGSSSGSSSSSTSSTRSRGTFTATAGQTIFSGMTAAYTLGVNALDVYVNGVEQTINLNWSETSTTSFTMTYGLAAGDIVEYVVAGVVTQGPVQVHGSSHLQAGTDPIPYSMNYITASGAVTLTTANYWTVINKTVPDVTVVTLPNVPASGTLLTIKDGKGDASLRPITLVPASGTIDGATNYILRTNYGSITAVYNGSEYSII